MQSTSKTLMLAEISDQQAVSLDVEHIHPSLWFSSFMVSHNLVLSYVKSEIQLDRHSNGAHYLFADGHVEMISEDQIAEWINTKYNFAKPQ